VTGQGVGLAYADAIFGGTTTAYLLESGVGLLTNLGSVGGAPTFPNTGQIFKISALPVAPTTNVGFDIAPGERNAFINYEDELFEINPATGQGFFRGGTPTSVRN